jgi:hypothetical protein
MSIYGSTSTAIASAEAQIREEERRRKEWQLLIDSIFDRLASPGQNLLNPGDRKEEPVVREGGAL